jgi:hypothetical protein
MDAAAKAVEIGRRRLARLRRDGHSSTLGVNAALLHAVGN